MSADYRAMCAELVDAIFTPNPYNWEDSLYEAANRARALLAEPVAEVPTNETPWEINDDDFLLFSPANAMASQAQKRSRRGRPTPQPVAVSERLPGPEDCLDEGWAWFFNKRIGWRQAVLPVSPGYTHWLPAHALPVPLP